MKTTHHFKKLNTKTQNTITALATKEGELKTPIKLVVMKSRSIVYELVGQEVIYKVITEKGKYDQDIQALIDLDGINYFPKLYAYEEGKYLFMEKAPGVNLEELIESGSTDINFLTIKESFLEAFSNMIDRKRNDADFKLEHLFWSQTDEKLTWIDLGICDEYLEPFPSKAIVMAKMEEVFIEDLLSYRIKI